MKKTIREWLDELPEPYKTQAIENWKNRDVRIWDHEPNIKFDSLMDAISDAFEWGNTEQGYAYWADFYDKKYKQTSKIRVAGFSHECTDLKTEDVQPIGKYMRMSLREAKENYQLLLKIQSSRVLTYMEQEFLKLILANFDTNDLEEKKGFTWEDSFDGAVGGYIVKWLSTEIIKMPEIGKLVKQDAFKSLFKTEKHAKSALAFAQLTHIVAKYNEGNHVPKELFYVGGGSLATPSDELHVFSSNLRLYFLPFYTEEDAKTSMDVNADLWKQYWMID